MAGQPDRGQAGRPAGPDPFGWHPEPDLLAFGRPGGRAALRRLGEAALDVGLDHLYGGALRRPAGPDSYPQLRRRFFGPSGRPGPAPEHPSDSAGVLAEVAERVAPYGYNAHHPASFSYFTTPPLPMSVAGETIAQWLHQSVDVFHAGPAAALVEEEVTCWLRDLTGAGPAGWGVLTSGGVMANIVSLAVAGDVHLARVRGRDRPPRGAELAGARLYASDQAHFSIARACDLLGFPRQALRVMGSDDRFRLGAGPVAEAIAADRAAGLVPFCICAVAGSTNTGSVDRVGELAGLARREGLWLHADAAYGGGALLSRRDAGRVAGLDRADSVTIDPHKWFFQAFDIGALVVARREDLRAAFARSPEYYRSPSPDEGLAWMQFSVEGTRRFRALKLWASWKHLGTAGLGRLVQATNDTAALLARAIADSGDFEALPAEPELSVVCFRHLPGGRAAAARADPRELDRQQDRLARALEVSGAAWVSTTRLRGRTYLRAGVMNHLTSAAEIDTLLGSLRKLAAGPGQPRSAARYDDRRLER